MGVLTNNRSNVLDVAKTANRQSSLNASLALRNRQYKASNSLAAAKLALSERALNMKGAKSSSLIDQAIKIHNKKLDVISRENAKRNTPGSPTFGEAPVPLPKFSDTLRDDFGVDMGGSLGPAIQNQEPAMGGGSSLMRQMIVNNAASAIPAANRGPRLDQMIRGQLDSLPQPKKIVHPMLPQLPQVIQKLNDYNNADEAIADLITLDSQFRNMGLDITDIEDNNQFAEAFRTKFGDDALQQLIEQLNMNRNEA